MGDLIIALHMCLSLIALFLNLNLDFLLACRTAPNHSWKNSVESIMSILNLGLQCVGLMLVIQNSLKPAIDLLHASVCS